MEELKLAIHCLRSCHYTDHDMNRIVRARNKATGELKAALEVAISCMENTYTRNIQKEFNLLCKVVGE